MTPYLLILIVAFYSGDGSQLRVDKLAVYAQESQCEFAKKHLEKTTVDIGKNIKVKAVCVPYEHKP